MWTSMCVLFWCIINTLSVHSVHSEKFRVWDIYYVLHIHFEYPSDALARNFSLLRSHNYLFVDNPQDNAFVLENEFWALSLDRCEQFGYEDLILSGVSRVCV